MECRYAAACEVLMLDEPPQDPIVDTLGVRCEPGVRLALAIEVNQILERSDRFFRL